MSSLTSIFDECRKQPDGETLEHLRANYFIGALMNESDAVSVGGLIINPSARINNANSAKEKERRANTAILIKLMNDRLAQIQAQLAQIENELVDKYGVYFADDLAAEYLDVETNKTLMLIQDDEERRHAIANALNDGIKNGTVESEKIYKNTDIKEWLDVSKERENLIEAKQNLQDSKLDTTISSENNVEETHVTKENKSLESGLNSFFS